MAKKLKKSTTKKVAKKVVKTSPVRVSKPKATTMSKNALVALMIGLAVVVGVYAYTMKNQAVPADVMVVAQPNSFSFNDKFGDGLIDKGDWKVNKTDGVAVSETKADNLRMSVQPGAVSGKVRNGMVVYKEAVSDGKDFVMSARMYKPMVTGAGVGRSGIRFAGGDGSESEGVSVFWEVSDTTSEMVFVVNAGGTNVKTERVPVDGKQVQLALKRSGNEYLASYRMDRFDDDAPFEELGEPVVSAGSTGGKVRLFTSNVGANNAYPKVIGRFDSVALRSNTRNHVLNDNFAQDGALDSSLWSVHTKGASSNSNKANGNLVMNLGASTKPATGAFVMNTVRAVSNADVTKDKRGVAMVEITKPKVTGAGQGVSGVSFNSESNKNDESAAIRWVVTKDSSKLVFVVRNAKGDIVEKESVALGKGRNRLTLKLVHGDGVYRAMYRLGPGLDDDTGFKTLGSERNERLGAKGSFAIFASQGASGTQAPAVMAKFDSFVVSYY